MIYDPIYRGGVVVPEVSVPVVNRTGRPGWLQSIPDSQHKWERWEIILKCNYILYIIYCILYISYYILYITYYILYMYHTSYINVCLFLCHGCNKACHRGFFQHPLFILPLKKKQMRNLRFKLSIQRDFRFEPSKYVEEGR